MISLIRAELNRGADPGAYSREGLHRGSSHPLSWMLLSGHDPGVVRLLLENGGDPNVEVWNQGGGTRWPILYAALENVAHFSDLENANKYLTWRKEGFILDGTPVPLWLKDLSPDELGPASMEILRLLLRHGADPLWKGEYTRELPLAYHLSLRGYNLATRYYEHSPEVVRLLLEYSEGMEKDGVDARYIVDQAVFREADAEIFRMLFDFGITTDLGRDDGRTWLHVAARNSVENVGTYQGLIDAGIDPSKSGDQGKTACDILLNPEFALYRELLERQKGRPLDFTEAKALLCR